MKYLFLCAISVIWAGLTGCSSVRSSTSSPSSNSTLAAAPLQEQSADQGGMGLTEEDLINEALEPTVDGIPSVPDPFKPVNRVIYRFNDGFYSYLLRPVSRGYDAIVPDPLELALANAFANLRFPQRFAGNVLQGKFDAASKESRKFVLNSTAGVLGFWRISDRVPSLDTSPEDSGQTLGAWGIPHGVYLMLPFIGPSSLRDAVGHVADGYAYPVNYLEPAEIAMGARALQTLNDSEGILNDYDALKTGAIDFYESLKYGYIQNRDRLTEQ